ncbi:hypothetical protein Clow_00330 [Corynebacterium lowii]|uniref:Uncharacterized protein n=1 Tax=Corynebacterium lowii TaxID=1544413 RepID=A0A0Q1E3K5_9CORY|nr:hypothetical protein Clow_00330 [Corynebacterium lowii]MDP9852138.1 hypothetical protein [Corynebacterium lowii]
MIRLNPVMRVMSPVATSNIVRFMDTSVEKRAAAP